jgi:DNA-binding MarR family transcriptional regulator
MISSTHTSPTSSELAERLVGLFGAIGKRANLQAAGVLEFGDLSLSQVKMLHLLHAAGGQSVGDLAARLGISAATASRASDGLARAGLVERRDDPEDRRVRRVHVTDTGAGWVERFAAARLDAVRELVAGLDPEQQQRLFDALAPLADQARCAR